MSTPESFPVDRSMRVDPGEVVRTAWVSVEEVRLACRDRMAVGDVAAAYQRVLARGESAGWPCPVGFWDGARFVVTDGRHEFVATLMLGRRRLLVAWVEQAS
jgi:hypothetical protein